MNISIFKLSIKIMLFLPFIVMSILFFSRTVKAISTDPTKYWDIRSIDTMKYSRDATGAKINDPGYDQDIQIQVKNIKDTGANYIAIDTPYDAQFLPYLKRWVNVARENNLHIWYRGNFSAWEGWFGIKRGMSTDDHTKASVQFITSNPDLFKDGDIFSSCPECENGSFGDPRQTGKVEQYREFMISETQANQQAFKDINKNVAANYWSMNLDVAKLIMNQDTAAKLGGVVVIDHYVSSPQKLIQDADDLAKARNAKIILGEFGAPIPDLNGDMTAQQQSDWIQQLLDYGSKSDSIIGLNYWVGKGGSTAIWDDQDQPKPAVESLSKYFNPLTLSGHIQDEFEQPVSDAIISNQKKQTLSQNGDFTIISDGSDISIKKEGYEDINLNSPISSDSASNSATITLVKVDKTMVEQVRLWFKDHFDVFFP